MGFKIAFEDKKNYFCKESAYLQFQTMVSKQVL